MQKDIEEFRSRMNEALQAISDKQETEAKQLADRNAQIIADKDAVIARLLACDPTLSDEEASQLEELDSAAAAAKQACEAASVPSAEAVLEKVKQLQEMGLFKGKAKAELAARIAADIKAIQDAAAQTVKLYAEADAAARAASEAREQAYQRYRESLANS